MTKRVITIWNSLCNYVISAETVNNIKIVLDKFCSDQEVLYNYKADLHGICHLSINNAACQSYFLYTKRPLRPASVYSIWWCCHYRTVRVASYMAVHCTRCGHRRRNRAAGKCPLAFFKAGGLAPHFRISYSAANILTDNFIRRNWFSNLVIFSNFWF